MRLNVESCSHKNPECANSFLENPPNIILNRFFELNSVEIKINLNPKAQAVNRAQRQLRPERYLRLELSDSSCILFSAELSSKNWFNILFGGFSRKELAHSGF